MERTSFWEHVNDVLHQVDIVIEVLDARYPEESRNKEIERKVLRLGKTILFVINKCDLVSSEAMERVKHKLTPCVFISSKNKWGTTILKKKILELSKGKRVTVGIVGYPNVGKSSLINALSGRHAARTSGQSGFTKGLQKVRVGTKIMVLDTPGVFPKKKEALQNAKMGAVDYAKVKDPETVAMQLILEELPLIQEFYQVQGEDEEEILEAIGRKHHLFLRKGQVNLHAAARLVLKDWQIGNIRKRENLSLVL